VAVQPIQQWYGLSLASTTFSADSFNMATRARVQKPIDSLGAIKQNNITLTTTGTSGT
jgi:hypothetical protein